MLPLLLAADPGVGPTLAAWRARWDGVPDPPLYDVLGDLARYLIARLEQGHTQRFDAVFAVVEQWHTDGDHDVRDAATIGLLEALQNTSLHGRTKPEQFQPWLRPVSRQFWDRLDQFWSRAVP